jgi:hypothetical protein
MVPTPDVPSWWGEGSGRSPSRGVVDPPYASLARTAYISGIVAGRASVSNFFPQSVVPYVRPRGLKEMPSELGGHQKLGRLAAGTKRLQNGCRPGLVSELHPESGPGRRKGCQC